MHNRKTSKDWSAALHRSLMARQSSTGDFIRASDNARRSLYVSEESIASNVIGCKLDASV